MDRKEVLLAQVSQYIEENHEGFSYRDAHHFNDEAMRPPFCESDVDPFDDIFKIFKDRPRIDAYETPHDTLGAFLAGAEKEESFTEHMLRIIAEKGYDEAAVYHNVFMDRKLFNKIRNDPEYQPSKRTALLIAIALKLTVPEAQVLLGKAGFALTHCSKTDLIVEFCMQHGIYDIFEIF